MATRRPADIDLGAWARERDRAEAERELAAQVDGRHYTEFVPEVKALRKAGDDDAAAGLLLRLIEAVEREARIPLAGCAGVPGWYFDQLAAIYARRGMAAERGRLIQRQMQAQVQAETQGRIAKMKLDAGVAADTAVAARQLRQSPRTRHAPGAAEQVGRAAGEMVGAIARLLRLK